MKLLITVNLNGLKHKYGIYIHKNKIILFKVRKRYRKYKANSFENEQ